MSSRGNKKRRAKGQPSRSQELKNKARIRNRIHKMRVDMRSELEVLPGKLYRNDPCPCGSGQKFKRCCYLGTDAAQAIEKFLRTDAAQAIEKFLRTDAAQAIEKFLRTLGGK